MNERKISKKQARQFLVTYQGLGHQNFKKGEAGVLDYINRVGCVQYDPLNVVGRNPDLVLQSRIKDYKAQMLHNLLYEDRKLIDGWDKMMAIYSVNDWSAMKPIRGRHLESTEATMRNRGTTVAIEVTDQVLAAVKERGPLLSRDINLGNVPRGKWGHGKLSSVALDYLYTAGVLGVYDKKNTQKIYDQIENLVPGEVLSCKPPYEEDEDGFYSWYIKRRIGSVGLLWGRNGGGWLGHYVSNKALRTRILEKLLEEGEIIQIQVEDIKDSFYMRKEDAYILEESDNKYSEEVRILAPLDNLLWDRGMVETLFDFKYTWEVYVPKIKRKYGYYVLPVLQGDRFIGRFEPELNRDGKPLNILNWWWEEQMESTEERVLAIEEGFNKFCSYLGADGLTKSSKKKIRARR